MKSEPYLTIETGRVSEPHPPTVPTEVSESTSKIETYGTGEPFEVIEAIPTIESNSATVSRKKNESSPMTETDGQSEPLSMKETNPASESEPQMNWLKELPQEEGDYLWVEMWGCDCCVLKSGICWIFDVTHYPLSERPSFTYQAQDKVFGVGWGRIEPTCLVDETGHTIPVVTGWLRLESLPECTQ